MCPPHTHTHTAVWRQDDPTASTKFTLLIMRIACHGLFMLRRRRQSSASTLPNPQIILAVRPGLYDVSLGYLLLRSGPSCKLASMHTLLRSRRLQSPPALCDGMHVAASSAHRRLPLPVLVALLVLPPNVHRIFAASPRTLPCTQCLTLPYQHTAPTPRRRSTKYPHINLLAIPYFAYFAYLRYAIITAQGPCITCPGSEWHSPVLRQTCEPVWGGGGGTMSGSAQAAAAHRTAPGVATSLPLVPAAIQDLAHRRLLVGACGAYRMGP